MRKLHELLSPHLLRRLKKDVLKQLPPKQVCRGGEGGESSFRPVCHVVGRGVGVPAPCLRVCLALAGL